MRDIFILVSEGQKSIIFYLFQSTCHLTEISRYIFQKRYIQLWYVYLLYQLDSLLCMAGTNAWHSTLLPPRPQQSRECIYNIEWSSRGLMWWRNMCSLTLSFSMYQHFHHGSLLSLVTLLMSIYLGQGQGVSLGMWSSGLTLYVTVCCVILGIIKG